MSSGLIVAAGTAAAILIGLASCAVAKLLGTSAMLDLKRPRDLSKEATNVRNR